MKTYEFSGRTFEDAVSAGLEQLGVAIGDVTIDILQEGSKGLFGLFGSRQAIVRLTLKDSDDDAPAKETAPKAEPIVKKEKPAPKANTPQTETAPKKEKPAAEKTVSASQTEPTAKKEKPTAEKTDKPARKPRQPRQNKPAQVEDQTSAEVQKTKVIVPAEQVDRATAAGRAQEFLQDVTKLMGVEVSVAVSNDADGNVLVNMEGDTLGILIGRRGETLDALQYLTSLQVNKGRDEYTRVTLDTEGYRAKREEALIRLANRMANRAQKTGRKVSMEPMNPYERRILHSALQDHPAVTTHSEGDEPNRHVVITLKPQD